MQRTSYCGATRSLGVHFNNWPKSDLGEPLMNVCLQGVKMG
jgi:hypothetical protein